MIHYVSVTVNLNKSKNGLKSIKSSRQFHQLLLNKCSFTLYRISHTLNVCACVTLMPK